MPSTEVASTSEFEHLTSLGCGYHVTNSVETEELSSDALVGILVGWFAAMLLDKVTATTSGSKLIVDNVEYRRDECGEEDDGERRDSGQMVFEPHLGVLLSVEGKG